MKLLITGIVALITLAVGFWGCNDLSRTTYSGSDYVMCIRDSIIYVSGAGQREMV